MDYFIWELGSDEAYGKIIDDIAEGRIDQVGDYQYLTGYVQTEDFTAMVRAY